MLVVDKWKEVSSRTPRRYNQAAVSGPYTAEIQFLLSSSCLIKLLARLAASCGIYRKAFSFLPELSPNLSQSTSNIHVN